MNLETFFEHSGATLAPDGIPLRFGEPQAEYEAAHNTAVLMDRSHEGRFETSGRDRLDIINRISTNDVIHMQLGEGRPTILTSPTGRIIDRLIAYNCGETALITTEPGRGIPVRDYLKRQIFFNDDVKIRDLSSESKQFALHGPIAEEIVRLFVPTAGQQAYLEFVSTVINDAPVTLLKRKPIIGTQWIMIVPSDKAVEVWQTVMAAGRSLGLQPAGSLTFNTLRIESGRPGVGRELSADFIPLEAGLWDEVNFAKGCYTGQEIIARMESRNRLAKTIVTLKLSNMIESPQPLKNEGREVGILTSSVVTPQGQTVGIGFVKVPQAEPGHEFTVGETATTAQIVTLAGAQPPKLETP